MNQKTGFTSTLLSCSFIRMKQDKAAMHLMQVEGALHELRPERVVLLGGVQGTVSAIQIPLRQQAEALPHAKESCEALSSRLYITGQHLHACMHMSCNRSRIACEYCTTTACDHVNPCSWLRE